MTQTFEQWAESEGLDMSVDWKGELTSPVTVGALRGWEAAQPKWMSSETAPKDGTEVALLFADEVTVLDKVRPRVRAASWLGDWTIPYRRDNPPTHWMPLPAAPTDEVKNA
ncbi:DUF551 domain-containing protein [Pandoraea apista]|uniref:DUF551 domain-containing protein n=1 Tax=Pandoraea apista TaxID=93218 RepID=UPI002F930736